MARKKSELLNDNQNQFVDNLLSGLNVHAAGAALPGNNNGAMIMNIPKVQEELARARAQIEDATLLRRVDTINGILDGIQMAKLMGDSGNVIKGWVEIGKILGHYAPEVRKIEFTGSQARIRSQLEALSDEELLAIHEGAQVVEGERVQ
jgi:hypothetical protein